MKKKQTPKRLSLSRETLTVLGSGVLRQAEGAAVHVACQESHIICSIMHTCVSCRTTTLETA
ncbi:MAG TPA: hypothetical protein VMW27_19520 [Thermoanaerobaculia bacterium]|nr:hypothetical protein [Thermoanaerobaculia bacterium]